MVADGDLRHAVNTAIAVLIITCPCALGLAVPAVVTAASGRLFRRGYLIRNASALERLAEVDHVVFDKTGTLTTGELAVTGGLPVGPRAGVALALAEGSAHPMARAVARALRREGVLPSRVTGLREVPGQGVEALWQGKVVRLGRLDWLGLPTVGTGTALMADGQASLISLSDQPRDGAAEAVAALQARGIGVTLLSGDRGEVATAFGAAIGIKDARGDLSPEGKVRVLEDLARAGARVLMIGDGLNDTGALAAAHVSMAPGTALDAARSLADVVVLAPDLHGLAGVVGTARKSRRLILQNFGVAALYNIVSVPLAVVGLASPLAAALAMSTSSIVVSLNALRAR